MHTVWRGTLLIILISIQGLFDRGAEVDKGGNLYKVHRGRGRLFSDVASENRGERGVDSVYMRVRSLLAKGRERQRGAAYFFPRGHEVLVGFEDVRQSLLDVFLLHAGQHSGGQEQWQTPLLSVVWGKKERSSLGWNPVVQIVRRFPCSRTDFVFEYAVQIKTEVPSMWICWICFGKSFTDSHVSKCELGTKKGCTPENDPCKILFKCLEVKLMVYLKKGWCSYTHNCVWDKHLLDVLERNLLALPGCHGEDIHLQGSQPQCGVVLQLGAEPL